MTDNIAIWQRIKWHWKLPYGDYWNVNKKLADKYSTYLVFLVAANVLGWPAAVLFGLYNWTGDTIVAFAGWFAAQFFTGSLFGSD